jgi:hypothetical protein
VRFGAIRITKLLIGGFCAVMVPTISIASSGRAKVARFQSHDEFTRHEGHVDTLRV